MNAMMRDENSEGKAQNEPITKATAMLAWEYFLLVWKYCKINLTKFLVNGSEGGERVVTADGSAPVSAE